jgi:hypothetical protein
MYKFQKKHKEIEIQNIQREVEDNFSTKEDVLLKENKVEKAVKEEPQLLSMNNGEKKYYNDGTNVFKYIRVGGKLYKIQLTEV